MVKQTLNQPSFLKSWFMLILKKKERKNGKAC